jgi:hypothetical protein
LHLTKLHETRLFRILYRRSVGSAEVESAVYIQAVEEPALSKTPRGTSRLAETPSAPGRRR